MNMSKDVFEYDFSGWATKYNVGCSDGRTILPGAFQHADDTVVPLCFNHNHTDVSNIVGKALLHSTDDGVYMYGNFNDSERGIAAKEAVAHGDIDSLSIYANHLRERDGDVYHGDIKEVSLVLSGANIEAKIDNVMCHDSEEGNSAIIYSGIEGLALEDSLLHSDDDYDDEEDEEDEYEMVIPEEIAEDFENLSDEEKLQVMAIVEDLENGEYTPEELLEAVEELASEEDEEDEYDDEEDEYDDEEYDDEEEGDDDMKHSAFDAYEADAAANESTLRFADAMLSTAKSNNASFRDTILAHSDEFDGGELYHDDANAAITEFMSKYPRVEKEKPGVNYGVTNLENLYPEPTAVGGIGVLRRRTDWVGDVLNGASKTGFSRIRATYADFKEDSARAKGYLKGAYKKSEVISLLRRKTEPATIYIKQTFDRDDLIDTASVLELAPYVKKEMQESLDEEKALAMLVGDGRDLTDEDKIKPDAIRPIACEPDLFNIKWQVAAGANFVWDLIAACRKSRKNYRGSGNLTMFTSEFVISTMLVVEDALGRKMFKSRADVAKRLGVSKIVTVPRFMTKGNFIQVPAPAGATNGVTSMGVLAILVNMKDYTIGTDAHSHRAFFEDFDIDFNKEKYLYEERFCGAMTEPFSAITLYLAPEGESTKSLEPATATGRVDFKEAMKGSDKKTKVKSDRTGYEADDERYFGEAPEGKKSYLKK